MKFLMMYLVLFADMLLVSIAYLSRVSVNVCIVPGQTPQYIGSACRPLPESAKVLHPDKQENVYLQGSLQIYSISILVVILLFQTNGPRTLRKNILLVVI